MSFTLLSRARANRFDVAFRNATGDDAFWRGYKAAISDLPTLIRQQGLIQGLAIAEVRSLKESDNQRRAGRSQALCHLTQAFASYLRLLGVPGKVNALKDLWRWLQSIDDPMQLMAHQREIMAIIVWQKLYVEVGRREAAAAETINPETPDAE
jgi:CRISPR/Cas system CMR-associated protein Cmr5 small subunit